MKQNFAPQGASILNLIDQIEFSNLDTDSEKAEFAYRRGLRDAARAQHEAVKVEMPAEYQLEGEGQE